MESTMPQQIISQMRQSLGEMDISPAKKMEVGFLLDKVEAKGGIAPKELKILAKLLEAEEKQTREIITLARLARKKTDEFIRKTDQIFTDYLSQLNKL